MVGLVSADKTANARTWGCILEGPPKNGQPVNSSKLIIETISLQEIVSGANIVQFPFFCADLSLFFLDVYVVGAGAGDEQFVPIDRRRP